MHYRVYICQQEWKLPPTLSWNTRGKFSEAVPITTTFWVLLHEYVRIQLTCSFINKPMFTPFANTISIDTKKFYVFQESANICPFGTVLNSCKCESES